MNRRNPKHSMQVVDGSKILKGDRTCTTFKFLARLRVRILKQRSLFLINWLRYWRRWIFSSSFFNIDETGLFWKRMPSRTFISKEDKSMLGFKPEKVRLPLLVGTNAARDFILKPLLVYHSKIPRALKSYNKLTLWHLESQSESLDHHDNLVAECCKNNNLDNKALFDSW